MKTCIESLSGSVHFIAYILKLQIDVTDNEYGIGGFDLKTGV
jgi:hypothetical protein